MNAVLDGGRPLAYVEAARQSGDLVHQDNRILVP